MTSPQEVLRELNNSTDAELEDHRCLCGPNVLPDRPCFRCLLVRYQHASVVAIALIEQQAARIEELENILQLVNDLDRAEEILNPADAPPLYLHLPLDDEP